MTTAAYRQLIAAPPRDRLDLFLTTANRLGAPISNVEKDFWVCWTLNALYRERPAGGPPSALQGRVTNCASAVAPLDQLVDVGHEHLG